MHHKVCNLIDLIQTHRNILFQRIKEVSMKRHHLCTSGRGKNKMLSDVQRATWMNSEGRRRGWLVWRDNAWVTPHNMRVFVHARPLGPEKGGRRERKKHSKCRRRRRQFQRDRERLKLRNCHAAVKPSAEFKYGSLKDQHVYKWRALIDCSKTPKRCHLRKPGLLQRHHKGTINPRLSTVTLFY